MVQVYQVVVVLLLLSLSLLPLRLVCGFLQNLSHLIRLHNSIVESRRLVVAVAHSAIKAAEEMHTRKSKIKSNLIIIECDGGSVSETHGLNPNSPSSSQSARRKENIPMSLGRWTSFVNDAISNTYLFFCRLPLHWCHAHCWMCHNAWSLGFVAFFYRHFELSW